MKEKELNDIRMQSGIIRDLQTQIASLQARVEEYKAVMSALSPTEGLIAEGMLGFIRVFTTKMNHLIGKTWSYQLEVVPCGLSSEGSVDLDYKFPLLSQASNKPVPDVMFGSRGMKEIINLVFRVVAMQYLGLADVPLYLDEFASALDDSHRRSSVDLIKMLMAQMSFSQLFMVSHDFSQYGALSDVEVCALTEENIVLPPVYNTHVSFT
jgi:DNA repair exonuclease SbcCD ATPase subunit